MEKEQIKVDKEKLNLFRRSCDNEAVFIDAWCPGAGENKVPEEELLSGEITAVTFQVGCYTVRSAQRVYKVDEPGYSPESEQPASKAEVDIVRKDLVWDRGLNTYVSVRPISSWSDKLRITHEISARHNSNPAGAYTYICRATQARSLYWSEYIGDIYAVKENDAVPDECASLLVYFVWTGDSHGVDTWYRFDPDGKIEIFKYDSLFDRGD